VRQLVKCIKMKEVSDEKLLQYWKSPLFSGSYSGIRTFQATLKTDLNIVVSQARLLNILKKEPIFLIHQRKHTNFERKHYDLNNYGELLQCDIAHMFDYDGYKYFLLVIDCYSSKLFVEPLKSKSAPVVAKALEKCIKRFKTTVYVLESDRGKEFLSKPFKEVCKNYNIYYKSKFNKNKSAYAERYIFLVKRKLYMLLRAKLSENWVKYIQNVANNLNNLPIKKLGFLRPNDIVNEASSVEVSNEKEKHNIPTFRQPTFEKQRENEVNDAKSEKTFKVGDFVYKQFDVKMFDKKYNIAVRLLKL